MMTFRLLAFSRRAMSMKSLAESISKRRFDSGIEIYKQMRENRPKRPELLQLLNTLHAAVENSDEEIPRDAVHLFEQIFKDAHSSVHDCRGFMINEFNTLLSVLIASKRPSSDLFRVMALIGELNKNGSAIKLDTTSMHLLLRGLLQHNDLDEAKKILDYSERLRIPVDHEVYERLILAYLYKVTSKTVTGNTYSLVNQRHLESASELTIRLTKTRLCINPRIVKMFMLAYNRISNVEGCRFWIDVAERMELTPLTKFYNILVDTYCKSGDLDSALNTVQTMLQSKDRDHLYPNSFTFGSLLHLLSDMPRSQGKDRISHLLQKMKTIGVPMKTENWNVLLWNEAKKGRVEAAYEWFQAMINSSCDPNTLSFNSLIVAHATQVNVHARNSDYFTLIEPGRRSLDKSKVEASFEKAIKVYRDMQMKEISPNAKTINTLMHLAIFSGAPRQALHLCEEAEFKYKNIKSNIRSNSAVLGEETDLDLANTPFLFDRNTFNTLLSVNVRLKDFNAAQELMGNCRDKYGFEPDQWSYAILLRQLCVHGHWDEANKWLNVLRKRKELLGDATSGVIIHGQKHENRQLITSTLRQLVVDSYSPAPDPPKVIVRDETRFMGENGEGWDERAARKKLVKETGFNADIKQPYKSLGDPELDVRRLVLRAMKISDSSVTGDQPPTRAASSKRKEKASQSHMDLGESSAKIPQALVKHDNEKPATEASSKQSRPVRLSNKKPYRNSGYHAIKSHVQESQERLRAIKTGTAFEDINWPLQQKYNRRCVLDKINEQTMFDATVDVKYEESGWPKRLAHHQKILKPVHYGQDENPPLTLFRLNTSRLKSNHNAPVSSSKETLNGEEDDLVLGNLKAKKITATSRQPKNNRQTLNSITWTPWQAYLKSIDGKVKEFLKSHDKRAVELTDALEKMSLRRADIFHETWAIVDEILQEKIDGDIGTKVQNEIHQRRDARNKELTGLIREWNVMKERMKAESDKALEFDENIWKLMRGWLEDGVGYGDEQFMDLLKLIPQPEWSRNITQVFLRLIKDKAFKMSERKFVELTLLHSKDMENHTEQ